MISSHCPIDARGRARPWATGAALPVPYSPDCYLCPGNVRVWGERNPRYTGVFAFDNDLHPCVGPSAPEPLPLDDGPVPQSARADGPPVARRVLLAASRPLVAEPPPPANGRCESAAALQDAGARRTVRARHASDVREQGRRRRVNNQRTARSTRRTSSSVRSRSKQTPRRRTSPIRDARCSRTSSRRAPESVPRLRGRTRDAFVPYSRATPTRSRRAQALTYRTSPR